MKISKVPLHLKLRLKRAQPPVWRDIAIPGNATLADLHQYIQRAFGWDNYHLHNFTIGRDIEFAPASEKNESPWREFHDEAKSSVFEVLCMTTKLLYTYDFGDNWEVEISCKGYYEKEPVPAHCRILKSKGENPPEDCGGVFGYMRLQYFRQHPEECDDDMKEMLEYYYPDMSVNTSENDSGKEKTVKKTAKTKSLAKKKTGSGKK